MSGGEDEKILVLNTGKSFMKYKSEERICALRTDNGGEYASSEFEKYLKDKGIRYELTVPDALEQNGMSEHMNRTLIESARSMIAHAGLPNMFWAEAISTAAYVRNCVPTRAIEDGRMLYELWYGRKPNVNHFKVFGYVAYVHIKDDKRRKLDAKVEKMCFVGYSLKSKGYRLYDESKRKVFVRRDVEFNENDFSMTQEVKIRAQE